LSAALESPSHGLESADEHFLPARSRRHGRSDPHPHWPEQARIAVQFVVNYEEGGENCILHGDPDQEFATALAQVEKIALIRLKELLPEG
jgi:peptidoglycan/xylan/chitin deacetylase (PgdA/CDA1 family)